MSVPGTGPTPTPPPQGPQGPSSSGPAPQQDQKDAFLLKSPFAKMFSATGTIPTAKEMKAIMNGILQSVISQIKQQDAQWKKAMQKLRDRLEGKDN